jgi:hypothetical protein
VHVVVAWLAGEEFAAEDVNRVVDDAYIVRGALELGVGGRFGPGGGDCSHDGKRFLLMLVEIKVGCMTMWKGKYKV